MDKKLTIIFVLLIFIVSCSKQPETVDKDILNHCDSIKSNDIRLMCEHNRIIAEAIANEDPTLCSTYANNTLCYIRYALAKNDILVCDNLPEIGPYPSSSTKYSCRAAIAKSPEQCDSINDSSDYGYCMFNVAKHMNNMSLCLNLTNNFLWHDYCIMEVKKQSNQVEVCDLLNSTGMKIECVYQVANEETGINVCDEFEGNIKELCISKIAELSKDDTLCMDLSEIMKDKCLNRVATSSNNAKICEQFTSYEKNTLRDTCYRDIAVNIQDYQLCSRMKSGQDSCLSLISVAKNDPSICSKYFFNDDKQQNCYAFYAEKTKDYTYCQKLKEDQEKESCYSYLVRFRFT